MQQRVTHVRRSPRVRLEPYPDPVAEGPPAWPDGISPAPPRGVNGEAPQEAEPGAAPSERSAGMELEGVYIISVAARLLEMHPQTLRKYERVGLLQPVRTVGMLRLYSQEDLRKVMLIRHLMDNLGLNLAGVEFALKLVNNLNVFNRRLARTIEDEGVMATIRGEVAHLCDSLSLPAPD